MNPLLLTPEQAFRLIGVGRSHGYKLIASGELPSIKIGRLRRIPRAALERWVAQQSSPEADLLVGS
jgi:excisionase family DNA binding protein